MKHLAVVFLVLLSLFLISTGLFLYECSPASSDTSEKAFVINQGDSVSKIAQRLAKYKFIRNRYVFLVSSYLLGLNTKIQAGTFMLSSSLTTADVIDKLSRGGSHDYWLKIIDGNRLEEIARQFPSDIPFTPADFLAQTREGYLFPDSYKIPVFYTVAQVLDVVDSNFQKKLSQAKTNTTAVALSDAQTIILASLIEREARTLESKRMVAGILLNRLRSNMPLQLDSSVQYARDTLHYKASPSSQKTMEFWQPLVKSDLDLPSPYNTYQFVGLPPSPICSPGYDSIYASYHPVNTDYLFYITGNDHQMHYAKTLDEHNINIARYLK